MNKKDIYFISDLHTSVRMPVARLELNEEEWVETQIDSFKQVQDIVGDDLLIITGDLLDNGSPYKSQRIVNIYGDYTPTNTIFIHGNHELLSWSGNIPLALEKGTLGNLVRTKGLQYLPDNTTFDWGEYRFYPFNYKHGRTLEHSEVDKTKVNIALGHFLSYPKEVPFFVKDVAVSAPDIIQEFSEFDAFVIGDNHQTFLVDDKYLSPGSLTRRTAKQTKHQPCVWKYNKEEGFTQIFLDVKPAEECLTQEHLDKKKAKVARIDALAEDLEVLADDEMSRDFKENLTLYMIKNKTKKTVKERLEKLAVEAEEEK